MKGIFSALHQLPKLMREFAFTSRLSFELRLEEGCQENGNYKLVYLAVVAPVSGGQ